MAGKLKELKSTKGIGSPEVILIGLIGKEGILTSARVVVMGVIETGAIVKLTGLIALTFTCMESLSWKR